MKKWENPIVTELKINETADGKYPATYEGYYGDCLCGNDDTHGHNIITGEILTPPGNDSTPEESNS